MALLQTLGVSSLLLTGVGYLAGRYRELRDASHTLVPADRAAFVATLGFAAGFSITQFLLGVESSVSALVIGTSWSARSINGIARDPRVRGRARAAAPEPGRFGPAAPAPRLDRAEDPGRVTVTPRA